MSGKRKYEEPEAPTVHESRQLQVPGSKPKPAKKPRNNEPPTYRKQAHASSVNAIKKRIRDVSRRLERADDLPANVRLDDERALAAYEQELAAAETEKNRQKMIKKYHMVRFFERQKATRILKKLRKRLLESTSEQEVEQLKLQMHNVDVDLNYTQFCPLSERYVSLYTRTKDQDAEEDTATSAQPIVKPPIWYEVEKCMEEGTLVRLRNRDTTLPRTSKKLELRPARPKPKAVPLPPDTSGSNRRERRSNKHRVQDEGRKKNKSAGYEKNEVFGATQSGLKNDTIDADESDGGFFED